MKNNHHSFSAVTVMRQCGFPALGGIALWLSCAWVGSERSWDNPYDLQGINRSSSPIITTSFTDTVLAINDTLVIVATATVENSSIKEYRWSYDDKDDYDTSPDGMYRRVWGLADTGKHRIQVFAVSNYDMISPEATCTVAVRACPPRVASGISDTSVAQKSIVEKTFFAADSNGTIVKYYWSTSVNTWNDSASPGAAGTVTKTFSKIEGGRLQVRWGARDDDGLVALDTFDLLFNRGPDSVWLAEPPAGDTARFLAFDDLATTGRISCSFAAHDPDSSADSLMYTFWLGSMNNDTIVHYSGRDTSLTVEKIAPLSTYRWSLRVKDLFGDSRTATGTLVTASPPAPAGGMVKVNCAGKDFQMGQSGFDSSEAPIHTVVFTKNFWIDTVEVTAGMFAATMGIPAPAADMANLPVVNVTWFDAALFCNARSKQDGRDTVYVFTSSSSSAGHVSALADLSIRHDVAGYRLPTEAEWEYANRLDSLKLFFWGNEPAAAGEYAWTNENSRDAMHVVATKKPNRLGLYDMSGNAWEWCDDWFDPRYYATSPMVDPTGSQTGSERVLRGGSWKNALYFAQAGTRSKMMPQNGANTIGFRTVLRIQ